MAATPTIAPMPLPYHPMPRKDDSCRLVLLIVAVVVAVVVIALVMASVLYVMVSGLLGGPGSGVPLTFSQPASCGTGCTEFFVTSSAAATPLSDYTVTFTVNGGTPVTAPLGTGVLYDANGITLTFTDVNGDGRLTAGDSFRVQNSESSAGCDLQLRRPGEQIGVGWAC